MVKEEPKPIEIPPEKQKELEERKKRPYPVGTGGEFLEERKELRLPALEVKNKVFWVNPFFKETMPFRIQEGKPLDIGVFFTPKPERYAKEKVFFPTIAPEDYTGRSGLVVSAVFRDEEGNIWRDVDLKGIGVFKSKSYYGDDYRVDYVRPFQEEAAGIVDSDMALLDREWSEKLLKAGIRTHRIIAISRLKEVIDQKGKKISIRRAKWRGMIPAKVEPVLVLRALGTRERIDYLGENSTKKRKEAILLDAKALVAQQQSRDPKEYFWEDYFTWFAKTLGSQAAKLRKMGLIHRNLQSQNITLDCSIVDLDTMMEPKQRLEYLKRRGRTLSNEEDLYRDDYQKASGSLTSLIDVSSRILEGLLELNTKTFLDIFEKSYQEVLAQ